MTKMEKIIVGWIVTIFFILMVVGLVVVSCFNLDQNKNQEPATTTIETTEPTEEILIDPSEWFVTDEKPSQFTDETYPHQNTDPTVPETTVPELITPETTVPSVSPSFGYDEAFIAEWNESAIYLAKTVWGEARGVSAYEQEKVIWCILNRVDDPRFPNTIIGVITAPSQFHGYSSSFPCTDEMYNLALDVIYRWQLEKQGGESNRNLGPEYVYFSADSTGLGNVFRTHW